MADTRQRAYNRIDTSNPQGSWIDEKNYNKGGTGGAKTLVGNWLEEERLEGDMAAAGNAQTVVKQEGRRFKGGFESTTYLLSNQEVAERTMDGTTVQRENFNNFNGDIKKQQKPPLGVRGSIKAEMVLAEAQELVRQQEEAARQRLPPLTTTYRETVSHDGADGKITKPSFKGGPQASKVDYAIDQPVTLYTGNPETGVRMKVQGLSETAGTGNPLAKNSTFTHNKYAL